MTKDISDDWCEYCERFNYEILTYCVIQRYHKKWSLVLFLSLKQKTMVLILVHFPNKIFTENVKLAFSKFSLPQSSVFKYIFYLKKYMLAFSVHALTVTLDTPNQSIAS